MKRSRRRLRPGAVRRVTAAGGGGRSRTARLVGRGPRNSRICPFSPAVKFPSLHNDDNTSPAPPRAGAGPPPNSTRNKVRVQFTNDAKRASYWRRTRRRRPPASARATSVLVLQHSFSFVTIPLIRSYLFPRSPDSIDIDLRGLGASGGAGLATSITPFPLSLRFKTMSTYKGSPRRPPRGPVRYACDASREIRPWGRSGAREGAIKKFMNVNEPVGAGTAKARAAVALGGGAICQVRKGNYEQK
ncbi:hypothetical protein EVAR_92968_1 [Eumeta japonica]|uniref:Uncharacterized protein n=1 Tax=Eumeta variegata TaxID=151549 RepID=A0A4C1TBC4_EUMVA|nr:hypothetical protein EVAR_92968_1 [Eumeta japonica]